jgi:hypothetical protein
VRVRLSLWQCAHVPAARRHARGYEQQVGAVFGAPPAHALLETAAARLTAIPRHVQVSMLHPLKSSPPAGPPAVGRSVGLEARGIDGRLWVCAGDSSSGLFWFLPDPGPDAPAPARAAAPAQFSIVGTPVPSGPSGSTEFTFVVPAGASAGQQIQVELGGRKFAATLPGLCMSGQTLTGRAPEPSVAEKEAEREPALKRAKGGTGSSVALPSIDSKLWPGAATAGWTLKEGHNYNWTYISPDGRRFSNRRTAQTVAGPLQEPGEPLGLDKKGEAHKEERGAEDTEEVSDSILDWGDRVSIRGLSKKPELNGQIALVKDFKAGDGDEEGRVVIELEESKT